MAFKQIASSKNPYIKELILLKEKSRARKQSQSFLIEGQREISLALKGNYEINTILFYSEFFSESSVAPIFLSKPILAFSRNVRI